MPAGASEVRVRIERDDFCSPLAGLLSLGVRWLDAALAVPFLLSAPPTAIMQNARLPQNESGVKPPTPIRLNEIMA
jgi:hypothetical protein